MMRPWQGRNEVAWISLGLNHPRINSLVLALPAMEIPVSLVQKDGKTVGLCRGDEDHWRTCLPQDRIRGRADTGKQEHQERPGDPGEGGFPKEMLSYLPGPTCLLPLPWPSVDLRLREARGLSWYNRRRTRPFTFYLGLKPISPSPGVSRVGGSWRIKVFLGFLDAMQDELCGQALETAHHLARLPWVSSGKAQPQRLRSRIASCY